MNTDDSSSHETHETHETHENSCNEELVLNEFWNRLTYRLTPCYSLKGHSRAAEKSCFVVPEAGIFFDAALQSNLCPYLICITHCHSDHSQALPLLLTHAAVTRERKPTILVPAENLDLFENYIKAHFKLSTGNPAAKFSAYELVGMKAKETRTVMIKKQSFLVETFQCFHTVPTIGYGLSEQRKRLKAEYQGLGTAELVALKKQDPPIQIMEFYYVPIVAYLCDTTHHVFNDPDIFKYPQIIIEVTYLYDAEKSQASQNKHTVWCDIRDTVKAHPQNYFILIHFSMKYKWQEIETFFDKVKMEEGISNIFVWKN